jgi:hypothetical protein
MTRSAGWQMRSSHHRKRLLRGHQQFPCSPARRARRLPTGKLYGPARAGLYSLQGAEKFPACPVKFPAITQKFPARNAGSYGLCGGFSAKIQRVTPSLAPQRRPQIRENSLQTDSPTARSSKVHGAGALPRPAPITPTFGQTGGGYLGNGDGRGKGVEFSLLGNSLPPLC